MANNDTLIKTYESKYGVEMKQLDLSDTLEINGRNINTSKLNRKGIDYILFNTFGLLRTSNKDITPLINMSLKDNDDSKLYLENIASYKGNVFKNNQTNDNPFEIYLYKKTDNHNFLSQIMFGNAGKKGYINFDVNLNYSNYLKALIIYDKCLEFITNLEPFDKFSQDDKDNLLLLYQTDYNKQKLIKGKVVEIIGGIQSPQFIIIFWKLLYHFTGIKPDNFFELLQNAHSITTNFPENITFFDVASMIINQRVPRILSKDKEVDATKFNQELEKAMAERQNRKNLDIKHSIKILFGSIKQLIETFNNIFTLVLNGDIANRLLNLLKLILRDISAVINLIEINKENKAIYDEYEKYLRDLENKKNTAQGVIIFIIKSNLISKKDLDVFNNFITKYSIDISFLKGKESYETEELNSLFKKFENSMVTST
jgi:hypothetical protein